MREWKLESVANGKEISTVPFQTKKEDYLWKKPTIDFFRLYILFSQYRSCDDTREIWSFVLFIKKSAYRHIHACFNEQDKESNLLSIITWSVLGKQNVQAKKVYSAFPKNLNYDG